MRCLAHARPYRKAMAKVNDTNIREVVQYLTAGTAEILLEEFNWTQDTLLEYLRGVWQNFDMTNTPLAELTSFDPEDNFDYTVKLKESTVRPDVGDFTKDSDRRRDQSVRWFVDVLVYTLKDQFEWSDEDTDLFVDHIDGYITDMRERSRSLEQLLGRLREVHSLDLRMHLR